LLVYVFICYICNKHFLLLLFGFIFPLLVHVFLVTQESQSPRFDFYVQNWKFLQPYFICGSQFNKEI
jgi:hypothetical protein